jgi:hypothetical protein
MAGGLRAQLLAEPLSSSQPVSTPSSIKALACVGSPSPSNGRERRPRFTSGCR